MPHHHTPAAGSSSQHDAKEIQALEHRARTNLLVAAHSGNPDLFMFWRGQVSALRMLTQGFGLKAAAKDAALSGYEAPSSYQAAWAALADRAERLSIAQVQQVLAAHGVEVAAQAVAGGDVDAVEDLKHGVVTAVDLNNEHAPAGIDCNNGSLHGGPSGELEAATVAQEGGAA